VPLGAQSRRTLTKARRLLEKVKLVDGPDSGLDADTVDGASPLLVRDATGAVVGAVVAAGTPLSVARRVDGRAMVLLVRDSGLVDTTCPLLCYESTDCTGTPYRDAGDALLPFVSVCGTTATYPIGTAATRTLGSCRTAAEPCVVQPPDTNMPVTTVASFDV